MGDLRARPGRRVAAAAVLALAWLTSSGAAGRQAPTVRLLTAPGVTPSLHGVIYRVPARLAEPGVLVLHGSGGLRPEYHTYASDLSRQGVCRSADRPVRGHRSRGSRGAHALRREGHVGRSGVRLEGRLGSASGRQDR